MESFKWIDKDGYRERLITLRDALPEDARSVCDREICRRVMALPEWRRAGLILTYLSMGSEVETRWLIAEALEKGKLVALPRCVGKGESKHLEFHVLKDLANLEESPFGVLEPEDDPATLVGESAYPAAIAIVPGLAFDRSGYRLGYGAGYYDRFLPGFPSPSIGLCREIALQTNLRIIEAHDAPVGIVVTEAQTIRRPA